MKVLGMKFVMVACLAVALSAVGCKSDKKTPATPDAGGSDAGGQVDSGTTVKTDSGTTTTDSGTVQVDSGTVQVDSGTVGDGGSDDAGHDAG